MRPSERRSVLPDRPLQPEESFPLGLAAAALSPGLRSVLIYDLPTSSIDDVAALWTEMLRAATGRSVRRVNLSPGASEDDLWGGYVPAGSLEASPIHWRDGLLAPPDGELRLVVIPDLARLGLVATRSCVQLVEAPIAHLERHGRSRSWRPELCWLAACDRDELGVVSPHLLDRFALRLHSPPAEPSMQVDELQARLLARRGARPDGPGRRGPRAASIAGRRATSCPGSCSICRTPRDAPWLACVPEAAGLAIEAIETTDSRLERRYRPRPPVGGGSHGSTVRTRSAAT